MPVDAVTLKVLGDHCQAAAESMAYTLFRTAHSTFVKETEDFTTGLATIDGKTFASPKDLGATWFVGLDYGNAIRMIPDYHPGDICITNDPYSGFVCTHSPDLHMWKPIFHEDELVCFSVGHIHNTDVGGAVPASLSRTLTEVHQEGIRFAPCKLYDRGRLNEAMLQIMLTNVRAPEQNWGDLKAQVASINTGERKVQEMIARFGLKIFQNGIVDLIDLTERQARSLIRQIPDGEYFFADYIDEDSADGLPCRIALTLTISGDDVVMDFTGSDPQLRSSLNIPTGGNERHILMMIGLNYVLYTLDPTLMLNSGINKSARCILPEGTIVNPQFPAAVGMRSLSCNRLIGVIIGAFTLALPDRLPAGSQNGSTLINVRTRDSRTGKIVMGCIDPITGGSGGSRFGDGSDGSGADTAFLKNTPIEINETEFPVQFLKYGLEQDSGGAGQYRGGLATTLEFQVFSPETVITARNRDRSVFTPFGTRGGLSGEASEFLLNPGTSREKILANTDVLTLEPNDILRIVGAGGGGWGDPFERKPQSVLMDVLRSKISVEHAKEAYGVSVVDGAVDAEATHHIRTRHVPDERKGHFRFGKSRYDFERVWTPKNYDALTGLLATLPIHWRFFVKHRIFAAIAALPPASLKGDGSEVFAAYFDLVKSYSELRHAEWRRGQE